MHSNGGPTETIALLATSAAVDGGSRHSVYFSIIDREWPAVKARLEGFLTA